MSFSEIIFHPFILPPILLIALVFIKAKSKIATILNIILIGLYITILFFIVPWPNYGSYYLRYLYFLLFVLSAFKPSLRLKNIIWFSDDIRIKLLGIIKIIVIIVLYHNISNYFNSNEFKHNTKTINLKFPLNNGTYYIHQGGISTITNYHGGICERYAIDIDKINKWGRTWKGNLSKPKEPTKYLIYNDSIYSPCNGKIIEVVNNYPDHETGELDDFKTPANKVVIEYQEYHVELLHLYKNSIVVNEGDTIQAGQYLGLVGNSGRSKNPHLHIHAYDPYDFFNAPVIILFKNRILIRNDIYCNDSTKR